MQADRYQLLGELGRGGMGAVLLAHDGVRQEQVAIKRVLRVDAESAWRLKREFREVERILHPNLVRLYELDQDRDGLFFTMEVIDGWDLRRYCWAPIEMAESSISSGEQQHNGGAPQSVDLELTLPRLGFTLPQIVEALSALHAHGLVHRDLKPSNVLVGRDGVVKLLARALERAGRYARSAAVWTEVAQAEVGEAKLEADLEAAYCLLAANALDEGYERLWATLRESGQMGKRARLSALGATLKFLLGPLRSSTALPPTLSPEEMAAAKHHGDRDLRLGEMVSFFDPIAGLRFLFRARTRFLCAGLGREVARCDYIFSYVGFETSRLPYDSGRSKRFTARADALVEAHGPFSPPLDYFSLFLAAGSLSRIGQWEKAHEMLGSAKEAIDRGGMHGTFEHLYLLASRAYLEFYSQRVDPFREASREARALNTDVGGSAVAAHLGVMEAMELWLDGRMDAAGQHAARMVSAFPERLPTMQRLVVGVYRHLPSIYQTDGWVAWKEIWRDFELGKRFRPFGQYVTGMLCTIAALNEVNAISSGDPQANPRRVRRMVKVALDSPPIAVSRAWRVLAYLQESRGETERALTSLERAEETAEVYTLPICRAISRYQRGLRLGGDEGSDLALAAETEIDATGASPLLLHECASRR